MDAWRIKMFVLFKSICNSIFNTVIDVIFVDKYTQIPPSFQKNLHCYLLICFMICLFSWNTAKPQKIKSGALKDLRGILWKPLV